MSALLDMGTSSARWAGSFSPALLHHLFERRAANSPQRVAVWCDGASLTYAELDQAAERLARRLRSAGVRRGDHVGLLLPRSAEVYVALLAVLKAGAAYVPLDPDYPAERVGYILEDCQAQSLITHSSLADRHVGYRGHVVTLDSDSPEEFDPLIPLEESGVTPTDVCYVIYTSGTTGRPKGVQIEHRSACHLVRAEGEIFGVVADDRVFQGFSIAFDASVEEVWLAFFAGAALVVGTKAMVQSGSSLARVLTDAGVTVFSTVPTLLSLMEGDLPTVRLLILGGEQCPHDLVTRWAGPQRRMVNTYGPTEATVIATFAECDPERPVTIGRAVPGYTVDLLDDQMNPVTAGQSGEICISGPGVARGYLGRPDLTREKFVANPRGSLIEGTSRLYRSGDLGRYNALGEIEFVGRIDSQVKLRGFRIELSEIESVLLEVPGVLACAVALREDGGGVPQLVAYVVPRAGERIDPRGALGSLRGRLPAYMVPSWLETLDALPTLSSGKVDRAALPAPLRMREAAPALDLAGRTELESTLLRSWAALFAPMPVALGDDFFRDLGGHSLLAARMVSELRVLPAMRDFSVIDVYNHPTIEALAAKLENDQALRAESSAPTSPERRARFHKATTRAFVLCGLAQAAAIYVIIGVFSLQWLAPYLTYTWMIERDATIVEAIVASMAILLAVYPAMLAASVAAKWLVVGRFKPGGVSALGGLDYFRWWFVRSFQRIVPVSYMEGTPLLSWYYRLMGARIGANVHIGTSSFSAFDLISIGDDTCLGYDTEVAAIAVEDGLLKIGPIAIGRGVYVGNRVVIRENTVIEDGGKLDDLSLLPPGARIAAGERWAGSPSRRVGRGSVVERPRPSLARRFAFGVVFLLGQLVFPLMVIGAIFPGVVLINVLRYGVP